MQEQWGSEFEFRLGHGWIRNVNINWEAVFGCKQARRQEST